MNLTDNAFHREQHFVSRLYLKRFAGSTGRVFVYRALVPHPKVRLWRQGSMKGVAFHSHLYTRLVAGSESDDVERWLDKEFETPAEAPLQKLVEGSRLSPEEWHRVINFVAAQDVRTPARLLESMRRWDTSLQQTLEESLENSLARIRCAIETGVSLPVSDGHKSEGLPFRVTKTVVPGQEFGHLTVETLAGRALWLWQIKHLLTETAAVLHRHRWTVLRPPDGIHWFTSDDPVVKLNFYGDRPYDFGGGWGSPGSEIILPISPRHLLYTQIAERPPQRGAEVTHRQAAMIRRFIAEHAHRMIFAASCDPEIPILRPRTVDPELCVSERNQWRRWHEEQVAAERDLMERGGK